MGTLIVNARKDSYEVIDGQQRLTSLFLLLNCLEVQVSWKLKFACRDKSNYTLEHIQDFLKDGRSRLEMDDLDEGLLNGMEILRQKLAELKKEKETLEPFKPFIEKLKKVRMFRIVVPENTDLNRHFEIMNTRGEQLEQHDILKARLMSELSDEDAEIFARIWEACSDMTGYVQMHFTKGERETIFGKDWGQMPSDKWGDYGIIVNTKASPDHTEALPDNTEVLPEKTPTIQDIIEPEFNVEKDSGGPDEDGRIRFKSVIEFPYFLLHVLNVLLDVEKIRHEETQKKLVDQLLDDKKLVESYERVIEHGVYEDRPIKDNKEEFVQSFILCLLKTRFLFDQYIIKREFAKEDEEGQWSLKTLKQSNQKPYYVNTVTGAGGNGEKQNETSDNSENSKNLLMLQSALRVSYISPRVMHWITEALKWLSVAQVMDSYTRFIEGIAKKAVKDVFLENEECKKEKYAMGVNTPHIAFNYLDYLIWKNNKTKYADFQFEFRNSVEHWYPQHPSEGTFRQWDDVDRFGNLCIVHRGTNSKFSNLSPESKRSTYKDLISKGSLKLRLMSERMEMCKSKEPGKVWRETLCSEHEEAMLDLLKKACRAEITMPEKGESDRN